MKSYEMITLCLAAMTSFAPEHSMATQQKDKDMSPAVTGTVTGVKFEVCTPGQHQLWVTAADDDKASFITSFNLQGSQEIKVQMQDGVVMVQNNGGCSGDGSQTKYYSHSILKLPNTDLLASLDAEKQKNILFVDEALMGTSIKIETHDHATVVATMPSNMTELDIDISGSAHLYLNSSSGNASTTLSKFQLQAADSAHAYLGKIPATSNGSISASNNAQMWLESTSFDSLQVESKDSSTVRLSASNDSKDLDAEASDKSTVAMCSSSFSDIKAEVEDSAKVEIGVTSNATVTGSVESSGSLTYTGGDIDNSVQTKDSGNVSAASSCTPMDSLPTPPGILTRQEMERGQQSAVEDNSGGLVTLSISSAIVATLVAFTLA